MFESVKVANFREKFRYIKVERLHFFFFFCFWVVIRCDLLVTANGKTEKIATGLLDPFLAHLKTAQDQVSKGGYSIILKPPEDSDIAVWFTKATIERWS